MGDSINLAPKNVNERKPFTSKIRGRPTKYSSEECPKTAGERSAIYRRDNPEYHRNYYYKRASDSSWLDARRAYYRRRYKEKKDRRENGSST